MLFPLFQYLVITSTLVVSPKYLITNPFVGVNADDEMNCNIDARRINMCESSPTECSCRANENSHNGRHSISLAHNKLSRRKTFTGTHEQKEEMIEIQKQKQKLKRNKVLAKKRRQYSKYPTAIHSKISNSKEEQKYAIGKNREKRVLLDRYEKKVRTNRINLDMGYYIENNFPTTYCISDKSDRTASSLTIYLDTIEKVVNYAAQTRNILIIEKALIFYEILNLVGNPPSRLLLQKADTLALSHRLCRISGCFKIFHKAIESYRKVLLVKDISNMHYEIATGRIVTLLRDSGQIKQAIHYQTQIVSRFPDSEDFLDTLGALHMVNRDHIRATSTFKRSLAIKPNSTFAMAMLGRVLYFRAISYGHTNAKQEDVNNLLLESSVNLLHTAIQSSKSHILDASFFGNLGDALQRLGRSQEANEIYEAASTLNQFPSFWQRSITNFEGIKSKPIWTMDETKMDHVLNILKQQWKLIRKEASNAIKNKLFDIEAHSLHDIGRWYEFVVFDNFQLVRRNCVFTPKLCKMIYDINQLSTKRLGNVKFSLMESGTHVRPHSGTTNCKLRAHLGIDVDLGDISTQGRIISRLRVVNEYLHWENGQFIVFDDSFDHEVWHFHPKNSSRLVLIVDIWHPTLTDRQIASIKPSFL